jgi:hypothetical protein
MLKVVHVSGRDRAAQVNVAPSRVRRNGESESIELPNRFTPQFWQDADGRCSIIKEIKRRYELLVTDAGADSFQKNLLAQRAVFVSVQLETMERLAVEKGKLDAGVYTQMTNSLMGLLKSLGLERKVQAVGLRAYMKDRAG